MDPMDDAGQEPAMTIVEDKEEEEETSPKTNVGSDSASQTTNGPQKPHSPLAAATSTTSVTTTKVTSEEKATPTTSTPTETFDLSQFVDICNRLNLDKETQQTAWGLLQRLTEKTNSEEMRQAMQNPSQMIACALYVASKGPDPGSDAGNGISLTQLLRATALRLVDFFTPLKLFIRVLELGTVLEQQLQNLEKKFCVISILYKKYNKEFSHLFHLPSTRGDGNLDETSEVFALFSFGWTLFLVAKGKLLADPPDLVNAFHLLLCCMGFLLNNAPPHLKKTVSRRSDTGKASIRSNMGNLMGGPSSSPPSSTGDETSDALAFLADHSGANLAEILVVEERLFEPFINQLKEGDFLSEKNDRSKRSSSGGSGGSGGSGSGGSGGVATPNKRLMRAGDGPAPLNKTTINSSTRFLNSEYELMYHRSGDFDERQFLIVNEIGTPSRLSSQYLQYYDYNNRGPATPSSVPIVGDVVVPPTPVASALHNVYWLTDNLQSREAAPSAILKKFFAACDPNPEAAIVARVATCIESFPTTTTGEAAAATAAADDELAQRRTYGIKLYYKILESMLLAEEDRLLRMNKEVNFSTLLSHHTFHISLLACCMEIIYYSYRMIDHSFPAVLDTTFHIHAFDFSKVIESVIRYETTLPRAVVRHLIRIEEQILESLAWQDGSPLFTLLENPGHRQNLALLANTTLSQHNSIPVSPAKPAQATATPQRGASQSLQHFFRKLFQLASERARSLCTQLMIRPEIFVQIWNALVAVLIEHHTLLKDRHLDQILLCVVYGVCKVNKLRDIAFRKILEKYRALPGNPSQKIYRTVVLGSKEETGDIIKFYNSIFIPRLEGFLLQFTATIPTTTPTTATSASPSASNNTLSAPGTTASILQPSSPFAVPQSPLRLTSTLSVTSPMRESTVRNLVRTNTPRVLYSFGQSPMKDLQTINRAVNSPQVSSPAVTHLTPQRRETRAKRHLFDDIPEPSSSSSASNSSATPTPSSTSGTSSASTSPLLPATSLQRKLNDLASAASLLEDTSPTNTIGQGDPKRRKLRHTNNDDNTTTTTITEHNTNNNSNNSHTNNENAENQKQGDSE